jgi:Uma2 family endonuclease
MWGDVALPYVYAQEGCIMALKVTSELGNRTLIADEVRVPGWSEERFLAEAPEEGFYEFKDGELIMHSPVNVEHQRIAGFLATLLDCFVTERNLGEVFEGPGMLKLRDALLREPDIFVVSSERAAQIEKQYVRAPVELVIEIVSPESVERDLIDKRAEYHEAGIEEYWAVDFDDEKITVHTRPGGNFQTREVTRGTLQSEVLSGFWIRVDWLWQRPLPSRMECLKEIL